MWALSRDIWLAYCEVYQLWFNLKIHSLWQGCHFKQKSSVEMCLTGCETSIKPQRGSIILPGKQMNTSGQWITSSGCKCISCTVLPNSLNHLIMMRLSVCFKTHLLVSETLFMTPWLFKVGLWWLRLTYLAFRNRQSDNHAHLTQRLATCAKLRREAELQQLSQTFRFWFIHSCLKITIFLTFISSAWFPYIVKRILREILKCRKKEKKRKKKPIRRICTNWFGVNELGYTKHTCVRNWHWRWWQKKQLLSRMSYVHYDTT